MEVLSFLRELVDYDSGINYCSFFFLGNMKELGFSVMLTVVS